MQVNWDPKSLDVVGATNLKARKTETKEQLEGVALQFEALFLQQLLAEMRKTVPENDLFGDKKAEKIFESMLDQELALDFARAQSIGLSKMIVDQLQWFVDLEAPKKEE